MTLFDITISSLKRQKSKKAFILIAMILSITTVLTLYTFTKSQTYKIESQFDEYGANIIITPKTDSLSLSYGGISFNEVVSIEEINKKDLEKISTIKDIASIRAISPKLVGAVNVKTATTEQMVVIVGTDFSSVFKINGWWDDTENIPEDENDLIIGFDVADKLGLQTGDSIEINNLIFHVAKVLEVSGNQDDEAIIANLEVVEALLNKPGKVSLVEISALCSECPIEDLVNQISEVLPNSNVRALREVMIQRMEVIGQVEKFAISISLILILLCSLLIFSNMAASVNERKHEIGIYRAIGFCKSHIIQVIQLESLIISFTAGVLGIGLSIIASYVGLPRFADIEVGNVLIDKVFFIKGFIVVLLLGFVSSLLPAIKASNCDPVKTINSL
ncbi:MAG: ABC transporter permease [Spirochaetaceae bacterium]